MKANKAVRKQDLKEGYERASDTAAHNGIKAGMDGIETTIFGALSGTFGEITYNISQAEGIPLTVKYGCAILAGAGALALAISTSLHGRKTCAAIRDYFASRKEAKLYEEALKSYDQA